MKQYSTILDIIMAQTRITFHYKREKISLPKYAGDLNIFIAKEFFIEILALRMYLLSIMMMLMSLRLLILA